MFNAAIITLSDKGSRGEREDLSGKAIEDFLAEMDGVVVAYELIPDEPDQLKELLVDYSDTGKAELILTTGGTGLAPRDKTPEATLEVIDKLVPGIAESMRYESMKKTPHGMLSRAVCGVRKKTLIVNLPGSPKAVKECLAAIKSALPHAIELIQGRVSDCASPDKKGKHIKDKQV